MVIYNTNGDI